jgi:hypothetical protein
MFEDQKKEFVFSATTDVSILPPNHRKLSTKHCPKLKSEYKLTFASSGMFVVSPS